MPTPAFAFRANQIGDSKEDPRGKSSQLTGLEEALQSGPDAAGAALKQAAFTVANAVGIPTSPSPVFPTGLEERSDEVILQSLFHGYIAVLDTYRRAERALAGMSAFDQLLRVRQGLLASAQEDLAAAIVAVRQPESVSAALQVVQDLRAALKPSLHDMSQDPVEFELMIEGFLQSPKEAAMHFAKLKNTSGGLEEGVEEREMSRREFLKVGAIAMTAVALQDPLSAAVQKPSALPSAVVPAIMEDVRQRTVLARVPAVFTLAPHQKVGFRIKRSVPGRVTITGRSDSIIDAKIILQVPSDIAKAREGEGWAIEADVDYKPGSTIGLAVDTGLITSALLAGSLSVVNGEKLYRAPLFEVINRKALRELTTRKGAELRMFISPHGGFEVTFKVTWVRLAPLTPRPLGEMDQIQPSVPITVRPGEDENVEVTEVKQVIPGRLTIRGSGAGKLLLDIKEPPEIKDSWEVMVHATGVQDIDSLLVGPKILGQSLAEKGPRCRVPLGQKGYSYKFLGLKREDGRLMLPLYIAGKSVSQPTADPNIEVLVPGKFEISLDVVWLRPRTAGLEEKRTLVVVGTVMKAKDRLFPVNPDYFAKDDDVEGYEVIEGGEVQWFGGPPDFKRPRVLAIPIQHFRVQPIDRHGKFIGEPTSISTPQLLENFWLEEHSGPTAGLEEEKTRRPSPFRMLESKEVRPQVRQWILELDDLGESREYQKALDRIRAIRNEIKDLTPTEIFFLDFDEAQYKVNLAINERNLALLNEGITQLEGLRASPIIDPDQHPEAVLERVAFYSATSFALQARGQTLGDSNDLRTALAELQLSLGALNLTREPPSPFTGSIRERLEWNEETILQLLNELSTPAAGLEEKGIFPEGISAMEIYHIESWEEGAWTKFAKRLRSNLEGSPGGEDRLIIVALKFKKPPDLEEWARKGFLDPGDFDDYERARRARNERPDKEPSLFETLANQEAILIGAADSSYGFKKGDSSFQILDADGKPVQVSTRELKKLQDVGLIGLDWISICTCIRASHRWEPDLSQIGRYLHQLPSSIIDSSWNFRHSVLDRDWRRVSSQPLLSSGVRASLESAVSEALGRGRDVLIEYPSFSQWEADAGGWQTLDYDTGWVAIRHGTDIKATGVLLQVIQTEADAFARAYSNYKFGIYRQKQKGVSVKRTGMTRFLLEGDDAAGLEEVRFYDGYVDSTGKVASDGFVGQGLVQPGQHRAVAAVPSMLPDSMRIFHHPGLQVQNFARVEEIALPDNPQAAKVFLIEYLPRPSDLILLPTSIASGVEEEWRPAGSLTPILVVAHTEFTSPQLAALAAVARRLERQILRVGLEEWNQAVVDKVEYLSFQY